MDTIKKKRKPRSLCLILVKNRLIAQLGINVFRYEKDKKKRNSKIAVSIAVIICLFMAVTYSGGIAYGYGYLGMTELIPGIGLVISSLITLFFTMFKANGELFGFKDYDIIMSLPIPVSTIINSRFLNMYIWNTFITLLIMLPMGIVYGYFQKAALGFYIMWIVGVFLAPLIPTTIAAVFGGVITAISSKFKYASAASTIFSIIFIVALLAVSMTTTSPDTGLGRYLNQETGNLNIKALNSIVPVISDSLNQIYPPAKLFTEGIVNGSIKSFLLFSGISVGWYGLFVFLLSLKYRQINSALTSHGSRGNYKITILHQGSMRLALYKKTILRILKSTVCATNLLIGCILAILLSVAMFIMGPQKVLESMELSNYTHVVKSSAGFVIAAIVCMTNTAVISLALEGKNIWLVKSLPIPPKVLYDSYLLTNFTFTIPTSVICSILFGFSLKMGVETILVLFTTITFSIFTGVIGIFVGNRMAYYDWQEETQLVKQSLMSLIGMLGGMIFIFISGFIVNIGILPVGANMLTFILDILLLLLAAIIYIKESTRPVKE